LLHAGWSKEKIVVVLKAYLDASGTDPNQGAVVVAGFAASEARWERFEQSWNALVKGELGLRRWHNTDFHNRHGEYTHWNDAQFLYAPVQAWKRISEVQPFGIGAAVKTRRLEGVGRNRESASFLSR